MQHQPDLTHLGLARLQLFGAITLPGMMLQQQTGSSSFLWIIRVDPLLNERVLNPFLETLRNATATPSSASNDSTSHSLNVVVLASNENPELFFRPTGQDDEHDYEEDAVLFGSKVLLESYRKASRARGRLVLETRLDADDALSANYLDLLQRDAWTEYQLYRKSTEKEHVEANDGDDDDDSNNRSLYYYKYYCVDTTIEWKHDHTFQWRHVTDNATEGDGDGTDDNTKDPQKLLKESETGRAART